VRLTGTTDAELRRGPLWDNPRMFRNRSLLYYGLVVIAAALGGYMVARQLHHGPPVLQAGTALPQARPVVAFTLTDHAGQQFDNARLRGAPSLVFFGFTHCPDVCPTTLALMAQLQRDPALQKLRMLFVTVDPDRDDQTTLQHYVDAFGGGLIGLRGDDRNLDALMQSLGAVRSLQPLPGGSYSVDHSATLFFLDGRGELAAVFTPPFQLPQLRGDLTALTQADR
jgi:protein SCO1/2